MDQVDGVQPQLKIRRAGNTYLGPAGARLFVSVFELSPRLSQQAEEWGMLLDYLQDFANSYARSEEDVDVPILRLTGNTLPPGVTEAFWYQTGLSNFWSIRYVTGLFPLTDGHVCFVVLEGAIGGLIGFQAAVSVAAMVAAHLS